MSKKVHPIAKVSCVSGLHGEVRLQPLSRYFDEYIETRGLQVGFKGELCREIKLSATIGQGDTRRFRFEGISSKDEAESLIGQTLFAEGNEGDNADLISKDILGYVVITDTEKCVGKLTDILWLPSNDVYVIHDGKKEVLIPVIKEIVVGVDHRLHVVMVRNMEGLL